METRTHTQVDRPEPESFDSLIAKVARRTMVNEDVIRSCLILTAVGPKPLAAVASKLLTDPVARTLRNQAHKAYKTAAAPADFDSLVARLARRTAIDQETVSLYVTLYALDANAVSLYAQKLIADPVAWTLNHEALAAYERGKVAARPLTKTVVTQRMPDGQLISTVKEE